MSSFTSLEQIEAARTKRKTVFDKARGMREAGQISDAEFQALKAKFDEKMAELAAAEAELSARLAPPPAPPDEKELIDLARGILSTAPRPPPDPEPEPAPPPVSPTAVTLAVPSPVSNPVPPPAPPPPPPAEEPMASADELIGSGALEGPDTSGDGPGDPFGSEGPPRGLEEIAGMAVEDPTPPPGPRPGDNDLMGLVRRSRGDGGESNDTLRMKFEAERAFRASAEKEASTKATEAKDMHDAFRRAVDEKDKIGSKNAELRSQLAAMRKKGIAAAGVAAFLALCVLLYARGQAAGRGRAESALAAKDKALIEAQATRTAEATRLKEVEGRLAARQGEIGRLTERVTELEQELTGHKTRVAELEAGPRATSAPTERVLELVRARAADPQSPEDRFLEAASARIPEARALAEAAHQAVAQARASRAETLLDALLAGRTANALALAQALLPELEQQAFELRLATARLAQALGEAAAAIAVLEGVSGSTPAADEARRELAAIYRKARRFDEGRRVLSALEAGGRANADDQLQLGMLLDMADDQAGAEAHYVKALALDPGNARARELLSSLAIQRADWGKARELLEKAREAQPEDAQTMFNLALAYLGLRERAKAEEVIGALKAKAWPGIEQLERRLAELAEATPAPGPGPGG